MSGGARAVFYISDSTGMTVEELGRSVLAQFEGAEFKEETLSFVDDDEKTRAAAEKVRAASVRDGASPVVFCSFADGARSEAFRKAGALTLDCLEVFVRPLEKELGRAASHVTGARLSSARSQAYQRRIDALNFTMNHDDGASLRHLDRADIILVGVSRSGKTPTSLHLALHYGIFTANYPLVEDDLRDDSLPQSLRPHAGKLHGLEISPQRLSEIRSARYPGSSYAKLAICRQEVGAARRMFETNGIPYLDVTRRSVEELASKILQEAKLTRYL